MIQEVFLESIWEEEGAAQQRRDERYQELTAAGLNCRRENLYTVDGRRVFVVIATPVEDEAVPAIAMVPKRERTSAPRLRPDRPVRRIQGYETR